MAAVRVRSHQAGPREGKRRLPLREMDEEVVRGPGGGEELARDVRPLSARRIGVNHLGVLDGPVARRENAATGRRLAVFHGGLLARV